MTIFGFIKNNAKTKPLQYFQVAWQSCALFALSILLGFSINQFRTDRLPLVGDWSIKAKLITADGDRLEISFKEAKKLFMEKSALFMDARSMDDYAKGHIPGALSLPWHDVDLRFIEVTEDISPDKLIITYCEDVTCDLSCDLALFLLDMGFKNVRVLLDGWAVWLKNCLPVEKANDVS
jgi:rhodanese-related sulfurtransferase